MLQMEFDMCDQLRQQGLPWVLLHPLLQARGISVLLIDDFACARGEMVEAT